MAAIGLPVQCVARGGGKARDLANHQRAFRAGAVGPKPTGKPGDQTMSPRMRTQITAVTEITVSITDHDLIV